MALRTDYKDDILDTSVNKKRVYNLIDQSGNVVMSGLSLDDVTVYSQNGDELSSSAVNEAFNNINNRNLKTYTSLSQLGLSNSASLVETWKALPVNAELWCSASDLKDESWAFPIPYCTLYAKKQNTSRGILELYSKSGEGYVMGISGTTNLPTGVWRKYVEYIELTGTLTAGTTTITLTNNAITTDSKFDFYTSIYGVNPTAVTVSNGSITLTFDAQETNMNVEVRVM